MAAITFSGLASGIDSTSLIKSLLDNERKVKVQPYTLKIDALTGANESFGRIKTLLADLNTAASEFRTLNGGPLAHGATSSNESRVSASVSGTPSLGSYTVDVLSLAKNATLSFGTSFSSSSSLISGSLAGTAADRTVSFQIGTGTDAQNVSVILDNTSTLDSFVSQFNSQTSSATASVIKVSNGDYRLSINSAQTGVTKGSVTLTSLGAGFTAAGVLNTQSLSQATDSAFTIDGLGSDPIVRSSNSVSDVISGVTLNLQDLGSAVVTVATDKEASQARVQSFVDAFNALQSYVAENDTVSRDESGTEVKNIFGSLAQTSVDNNLLDALKNAFSSLGSSGSSVRILADLGITTQRDGSLAFDGKIFSDVLDRSPTEVETLLGNLGEKLSSVDGTIAQFSRFSGILDSAVNSNKESIVSYTTRISDAESQLSKRQQSLTQQYAHLEAVISRLNSQQASLSSLLGR